MFNRFLGLLSAATIAAAFAAAPALAQSSGSFAASADDTICTASTSGLSNGTVTGSPVVFGSVDVQVSSGSGTALEITPSMVTGLFTDNKISSTNSTSTQQAGVLVTISVTAPNGVDPNAIQIAPNTMKSVVGQTVSTSVVYDERIIQVTSSVISQLAGCTALTGGSCFELVEATLAAHAFNWYITVPKGGTYTITESLSNLNGGHGEEACAGPGTLTVVQVKNFSFNSGSLSF